MAKDIIESGKTVPAYHVANIRIASSSIKQALREIDKKISSLEEEHFTVSLECVKSLVNYPADIAESIDEIRKSLRAIEEHAGGLIKLKIDEIT